MTIHDDPMNLPKMILPRDGTDALHRATLAAQVLAENRATDIVILDLLKLTDAFDYFVVASGTSMRQLRALSDAIDDLFEKELGMRKVGTEGYRTGRWVLCDYGDVVIHLFDPEVRDYYRLEDHWGGAERIPFVPREVE